MDLDILIEPLKDQMLEAFKADLKNSWDSFTQEDRTLITRVLKQGAFLMLSEHTMDPEIAKAHWEMFDLSMNNIKMSVSLEINRLVWNTILKASEIVGAVGIGIAKGMIK